MPDIHQPRPIWRSLLYVPVIVEKFVERAATRGADAIILDIEDSVPPTLKEKARNLVSAAAAEVSRNGSDVLVRVNRPWRLLIRDLEAVVGPRIRALVLPKVESLEQLCAIAEVVEELEAECGMPSGATLFYATVESATGFLHCAEIARHPRMVALTIGGEDLSTSLGMVPEIEGLFHLKQYGIIAARAAGVLPLGFLGTLATIKGTTEFRDIVRRSRRLGFAGAACAHPSQVPILNEEFAPTEAEVDEARRLIAAFEVAVAKQVGAATFEGKMIDVAMVRRAQNTITTSEAIRQRSNLGSPTDQHEKIPHHNGAE